MWVLISFLILAFALGFFVRDYKALAAPAFLGVVVVVVHLTAEVERRETTWVYGFVLGAAFAIPFAIVVSMGIVLGRAFASKRAKPH